MHRVILHLDADCFYAQVEQERLRIPRDVPFAVQQWGSLLAINYSARASGVARGMTVGQATKLCPAIELVHVPTLDDAGATGEIDRRTAKIDLGRYREASSKMFDVLAAACAGVVIEKAGLDEAYVDCTDVCVAEVDARGGVFADLPADTIVAGVDGDWEHAAPLIETRADALLKAGCMVAARLRAAVHVALRFTTSCGIAHNKTVAKQASALNKPNKQTMVLSLIHI